MAFLPLATAADAQGDAKRVLAETERKWGYAPNLVAALALRPELLVAEAEWTKALMLRGELPRSLKEVVATAVSVVNRCNYCATSHHFAAAQAQASEELREACVSLRFDALPAAERAALEFTRKCARDMTSITQRDVDHLRAHYTPAQVVELVAVIGSFMMYNTLVTALGLELEPQHGPGVLPR